MKQSEAGTESQLFAWAFLGLLISHFAYAEIQEDSIVFIQCSKGDSKTQGTGVIVGGSGEILTAKHLVPEGYSCFASLGNSSILPNRALVRRRASTTYDAALLALVPSRDEKFAPVRYVDLRQYPRGASIDAFGYPDGHKGPPSIRKGEISTQTADDYGFIETTALTATGMSGGPVFMSGEGAIIGIIAGAKFDKITAAPSSYGVLDASLISNELGLKLKSDESKADYMSRGARDLQKGDRALSVENWRAAIRYFRSVSRESENYYSAQMGRGHAELRLGYFRDAELSYIQALNSAKDEAEQAAARYSLALSIMSQRDYARALPIFQEVAHNSDMQSDEGLIYNLARCYHKTGDVLNAKNTLSRFPFMEGPESASPQGWHQRDIYTKAHLLDAVLSSTDVSHIDCDKVLADIAIATRINPEQDLPPHYRDELRAIGCRGL